VAALAIPVEPPGRAERLERQYHLAAVAAAESSHQLLEVLRAVAERGQLTGHQHHQGGVGALGAIAARHPRLRLIVDHRARRGGLKDDPAVADLDEVRRAALALAREAARRAPALATGRPQGCAMAAALPEAAR